MNYLKKEFVTKQEFSGFTFTDDFGETFSLQESGYGNAIWFGINDPEVSCCKVGMHLTRDQVKELLPLLQHFADTGDLGTFQGESTSQKALQEGTVKGGVNKPPTVPRPEVRPQAEPGVSNQQERQSIGYLNAPLEEIPVTLRDLERFAQKWKKDAPKFARFAEDLFKTALLKESF